MLHTKLHLRNKKVDSNTIVRDVVVLVNISYVIPNLVDPATNRI